jgi:hypothetical protein
MKYNATDRSAVQNFLIFAIFDCRLARPPTGHRKNNTGWQSADLT